VEAFTGGTGILCSFLTSELDRDDGQFYGPAALTLETTPAPTNTRPQSRSGCFGKETNAGLANKSYTFKLYKDILFQKLAVFKSCYVQTDGNAEQTTKHALSALAFVKKQKNYEDPQRL
jgi:hypothetical protein